MFGKNQTRSRDQNRGLKRLLPSLKSPGDFLIETIRKTPTSRSGVSEERRKLQEIEERGFLPKAATLVSYATGLMKLLLKRAFHLHPADGVLQEVVGVFEV